MRRLVAGSFDDCSLLAKYQLSPLFERKVLLDLELFLEFFGVDFPVLFLLIVDQAIPEVERVISVPECNSDPQVVTVRCPKLHRVASARVQGFLD